MLYSRLAEKLLSAVTVAERKLRLDENKIKANEKLAAAIKEICYDSWTSEPTKAQNAALALQVLVEFNPTDETKAYCFWVSGIARITEGKLTSAVKKLERATILFLKINKEHEAAQTQVAKLYPLALLGRYEEAVEIGDKALRCFEKYTDELAAGKVEKNLGNIVARQGDETGAEKYYLAARRRFLKIKNDEELAMTENSLANTYAELNDFLKAEKFYAQALRRSRAAKMSVTEAEIEASMGNLAIFRGKFDRALKFLELSRQKYATLDMPHQTAIAELEIADIYLELNLVNEASEIYERVADTLHQLKMQGEEARARANFGRAAIMRNEIETARKELKKSARLYTLEKNKSGVAIVKLSEANLELREKNYCAALKLAGQAEKLFPASENLRHKLTARWIQGEALRNTGENEAARKILAQTFIESMNQEQPTIAQSSQISLGKISFKENNYKQAEKHFTRAIELVETLRAPLPAEEFRMSFLADKLAPFENLAKIYLAQNKIGKAFLTIEKARARSLAETLESEFQPVKQNASDSKLAKKLEELREELNWFYSRLNRAEESEIENLQVETKKREKQIADVMRQIESTSKTKFRRQNSFSLTRLQNQLGAKRTLIEFVNFDGDFSAFVVTGKKIHYVANLASEAEIIALLENLEFQFGSLRYGSKHLGKFVDELKKRTDFYLRQLYEKLVKPLEDFTGQRDLTIVPVGALYYVPFHALTNGENYLIETKEVVYAPSATVWQFLAAKPKRSANNALLIGFADEKIPLVYREIKALEKIFRKRKSYVGEKATFAAYTKNAPNFDVLHFACHGQFRPENPLFSSLHLADGFVTVRDICSQKLNADLVTLSACETGLNKIFAGDEILGLARGFLSAGVNSLVLSLWTVNDKAAAELMKNFYENIKIGKTAAEALRISQCNFIRQNSHPYFWSPFALIGR